MTLSPLSEKHKALDHKVKGWTPSILLYLVLMNVVLLVLLFPSVSIIILIQEASFRDEQLEVNIKQMQRDLEGRASSLVHSLALSAGQAVAGYDYTFLNTMISQVVTNDPEIKYLMVMRQDRKIISHDVQDKIGDTLKEPLDFKVASIIANEFAPQRDEKKQPRPVSRYLHTTFTENNQDVVPVLEVVAPVYSGSSLLGALRCGYSLKGFHEQIERTKERWAEKLSELKFYFLFMTGIFFSIGVAVVSFFSRSLIRSISALDQGVSKVSKGNLQHTIELSGMTCVEFLRLTESFNTMTSKLRLSYQQLDEYSRSLEEKVSERTKELRDAQVHLMQQAHEAGMAEMAVGILHNIGNAMTLAKVSTSQLLKRLHESPINNLVPDAMAGVIQEMKGESPLSLEERERLLSVFNLLPESLREEFHTLEEGLKSIRDKHAHIESIINLQMRYAHLFGEVEDIDCNGLIDDSLQLLEDMLNKRSVAVERRYEKIPQIRFERAKLMQIMINLIKNAVEAMDEVPGEKRRLIVTTAVEGQEKRVVRLSVKDTGIGFTAEEKEKIFQFGFSTKKRGSGFGLHSSANYLIANHGSLAALSLGKGKGAEFVVRLPLEAGRGEEE